VRGAIDDDRGCSRRSSPDVDIRRTAADLARSGSAERKLIFKNSNDHAGILSVAADNLSALYPLMEVFYITSL